MRTGASTIPKAQSYITLERLAEMVRQKSASSRWSTPRAATTSPAAVLAQIIMEEESRGATMLPVNFLRQLISMYGDSMQSVVPHYLEASLEALQRNQSQFRDAMAGAFASNPFAEIARRNMEMFTAASSGRAAGVGGEAEKPAPEGDTRSELAALKAQLAGAPEEARQARLIIPPRGTGYSGFTNLSVIRSLSPIAR